MSKQILPCKKIASGVYASRYLKRAERLARTIKSKYGKETNIIDGCIVQGARANKTLSASSIELPGKVFNALSCVIPSTSPTGVRVKSAFTIPNRDPFHPSQESGMGVDFSGLALEHLSYPRAAHFGSSGFREYGIIASARQLTPPVRSHAGRNFLYIPHYGNSSLIQEAERFFAVWLNSMASGLPEIVVTFHDDYIKSVTGGYSIGRSEMTIQNMSSAVVEVGYGVFAVVFAVSKNIYQQVGPSVPNFYLNAKYETRLLLAVVDLKLEENKGEIELDAEADFYLFPEELIPENMRPTSILVRGSEGIPVPAPAPSIMTIQDLDLDENGNILAAIKYQVKVQSSDRDYDYQGAGVRWQLFEGHEGTGVMAFGLASWGHQGSYFNVHSLEVVEGDGDNDVVRDFGVSPSEAMFGERQVLIGGDVYRWGILVSRETAGIFATDLGLEYQLLPPYIVELRNGVPTGNNALNGPTDLLSFKKDLYYDYGISIDFERDFQLNNDWIRTSLSGEKALVSDSCYAIPAGGSFETLTATLSGNTIGFVATSAGVLFMDGDRRKFESLGERTGLQDSYAMTMSCHQREIRDENGKLVMPSALIVCAYKDDRPKMFIRKGPIWPEDFAEGEDPSDYSKLWVEVETANDANHYTKFVYVGNQLMTNGHGEIFQ